MIKYAIIEIKTDDEDFKVVSWAWNIFDIKVAERERIAYIESASWKPDPQNIQVVSYKV